MKHTERRSIKELGEIIIKNVNNESVDLITVFAHL